MKFNALIDDIHFNPKKGTVKIVLVGASHVSLDELTTLSPKEETVQVTLESEQTRLEYGSIPGDAIMLAEAETAKLKEAAGRLRKDAEAYEAESENGD
jgi:hypothetical protein